MHTLIRSLPIVALLALPAAALAQGSMATGFTYQGQLKESGQPASGLFDFRACLYDSMQASTPLACADEFLDWPVEDGLFMLILDFDSQPFAGDERVLELAVRASGSGASYTALAPRQPILSTPYSLHAQSVGMVPDGALAGTYSSPLNFSSAANVLAGSGSQITSLNAGNISTGNLNIARLPNGGHWSLSNRLDITGANVGIGTVGAPYPLTVHGSQSQVMISGYHNATSGHNWAISGRSDSDDGVAVFGYAFSSTGPTAGVHGQSNSTSGRGVHGQAGASSGQTSGVYGRSSSTSGRGVFGHATASSGVNYGVRGETNSPSGIGVYGENTATTGPSFGLYATTSSTSGHGVYGIAPQNTGETRGVMGVSASTTGRGVYGSVSSNTGVNYGVFGATQSNAGQAVHGRATSFSGDTYGGYFRNFSNAGRGVYAYASAPSGLTHAVWAEGNSPDARGIYAVVTAHTGANYGVAGQTNSSEGWGVYAFGRLGASGTKSFRIDHPTDPENMYLQHYSAEGPEPQNIYNGVIELDALGEAWVDLPSYFDAINRDPRYTLTPIGAAMPNLHIAAEVIDNRFMVAGGAAGMRVSWEVKAVRDDPWMRTHGAPVEVEKSAIERGKYQHPELFGQPMERALNYRPESASDLSIDEDHE